MDSKDQVAQRLIDRHFQIEPAITEIYRILTESENSPSDPIKLLEVSEATPEIGRVDAFAFGPANTIPFSSVIADVTPRELEQIKQGRIALPRLESRHGAAIPAGREPPRPNPVIELRSILICHYTCIKAINP